MNKWLNERMKEEMNEWMHVWAKDTMFCLFSFHSIVCLHQMHAVKWEDYYIKKIEYFMIVTNLCFLFPVGEKRNQKTQNNGFGSGSCWNLTVGVKTSEFHEFS